MISLASCGVPDSFFSTFTPIPTKTISNQTEPGCVSSKPTEQDINRALTFADKVIDPSEWRRSDSVSENRVAVTWQNSSQGAVIYIESLIFVCGYTENDLDSYFSDTNWNTIFLNYQNHQPLQQCKTKDNIRLYEFKAVSQELNYKIRFWVLEDTDMRVITTMIVFPEQAETLFNDYSARLFPNLRSCS